MLKKVNIKKSSAPQHHRSPWIARWREPDGTQPSRSFRTKSQAERFASRMENELNSDLFGMIKSVSWQRLTDEFLELKKGDQLAPGTIRLYAQILKEFGELCNYPSTDAIAVKHVDFYKAQFADKVESATINSKLRTLSAIFSWAVNRDMMRSNPVAKSGKLREPKRVRTVLTPDEFARILDVCTDPQWRVLIHLAVNGVARKYSIAKLTVGDIDFEKGTVLVYDEKQQQTRVTPLHPASMAELTAYVAELPEGRERLFTSKFHHTTWKRLVKLAGVSDITFHHLRTCMSSWLKMAGVSGDVVSKILGHSTPAITYKYYTALDDAESKRAAINKLPL